MIRKYLIPILLLMLVTSITPVHVLSAADTEQTASSAETGQSESTENQGDISDGETAAPAEQPAPVVNSTEESGEGGQAADMPPAGEEAAPAAVTSAIIEEEHDELAAIRDQVNDLVNNKHAVEQLDMRQANEKVFRLEDGKYQAIVAPYDIHYMDSDGNYEDISPELMSEEEADALDKKSQEFLVGNTDEAVDEPDTNSAGGAQEGEAGDFRAPKLPFDVKLPKQFNKGYSIAKGTDKLAFIPQDSSPSKGDKVDSTQISYKSAWQSTDVVLEVKPDGLKESIILNASDAPTKFSYEVKGALAEDSLTSQEFRLVSPWLIDAAGVKRPVIQSIRHEKNKTYIDLDVDTAGLAYPVTIDPTTSMASSGTMSNGSVFQFTIPTNAVVLDGTANVYALSYMQTKSVSRTGTSTSSGTLRPADYVQPNHISGFDVWSSVGARTCVSGYYSGSMVYSAFETRVSPYSSTSSICSLLSNGAVVAAPMIPKPAVYDVAAIHLSIDEVFNLENASFKLNNTNYSLGTFYGYTSTYIPLAASSLQIGTNSVVLSASRGQAAMTITYTYDLSPSSTLHLLTPNGGETIDRYYTIQWENGTDPDTPQSSLRYNIQYSYNGGTSWNTLVSLTQAGATSIKMDFRTVRPTTTCKLRIRAYDGHSYGPWEYSDNVFTVKHAQVQYLYDSVGRLVLVYLPNGKTITYTYDAAGNLISRTVS